MSWIKQSAKAGLSGLTSRELARQSLMNPGFQQIWDPLEPLIKEMNVSIVLKIKYICVMLTGSKCTVIINIYNLKYFSHSSKRKKRRGHGLFWIGRWGLEVVEDGKAG